MFESDGTKRDALLKLFPAAVRAFSPPGSAVHGPNHRLDRQEKGKFDMEVDEPAEDDKDKDKEKAPPAKLPEVKGTLDSQVYVYLMAVLHLLDKQRHPEVRSSPRRSGSPPTRERTPWKP